MIVLYSGGPIKQNRVMKTQHMYYWRYYSLMKGVLGWGGLEVPTFSKREVRRRDRMMTSRSLPSWFMGLRIQFFTARLVKYLNSSLKGAR
jgi:hypothetical protein